MFCALALALTYLPALIPQDILTKLSLLSYAYPLMLVINICFIVLWIFLKPRHILLSLFFVLIRVGYVPRLITYHSEDKQGELKVLTYNVKEFTYRIDYNDNVALGVLQDSILHYIGSTNADVVCLQDYSVDTKQKRGFHATIVDSLGYKYYYYHNLNNRRVDNCAIYSKLPIKNSGSLLEEDEKADFAIFADIKAGKQMVRICNLHLISYMLGPQEQSDYMNMIKGDISNTASQNILTKLCVANSKRAKQLRKLMPQLKRTQKALIVVGDMNDTPFSYTYEQFNDLLSDAFVSKGYGIGTTYNGVFPAYRIDYVFYERSRLSAVSYKSDRIDYSDHYPVLATFNIKIE